MSISSKLQYCKENTDHRKCKFYPTCRYCSRDLADLKKDFYVVKSNNRKIVSVFGLAVRTGNHPLTIYLCEECFLKLHELLEDIESEDWYVLDENEFPDLDNELEEENGSGK